MRRVRGATVLATLAAALGCHTTQYDTSAPVVEEFVVAPNEHRYSTPQEQGYRPRAPKKEFKGGLGAGGGPGPGGMGGGGPPGQF